MTRSPSFEWRPAIEPEKSWAQARRPGARGGSRPGRDQLGGETSPAACRFSTFRISGPRPRLRPWRVFRWLASRPPLGGLVLLARRFVELHQPLQGFGQADLAIRRDLGLTLFH